MKRLAIASILTVLLVLITACRSSDPALDRPGGVTGTYGDMFRDEVGGEILGVELRIVATAAGLQGALQVGRGDGQGGLSGLAVVDVVVEGERVRFSVPETHPYAGRFEGKLVNDAIVGRFELLDGTEKFVVLQRGDSFWD